MSQGQEKDRILFVDDEPKVLEGLQRSMRKNRDAWEMEFVGGGQEALDLLQRQHFDAVVTDLAMPKMNGMQLLAELARRYPDIGRSSSPPHPTGRRSPKAASSPRTTCSSPATRRC